MDERAGNVLLDHLGEAITLIVILVGNIVGYAKLLFKVGDMHDRLKQLEGDFEKHDKSPELHRSPDFERRMVQLELIIDEIRKDVKFLVQQEKKL